MDPHCNGGNMNSLQTTSGYARKIVIAMLITGLLAIASAAQKVDPQRQGAMYGDPGFRGEPINLNVVNADIRDILNYITEQYGTRTGFRTRTRSIAGDGTDQAGPDRTDRFAARRNEPPAGRRREGQVEERFQKVGQACQKQITDPPVFRRPPASPPKIPKAYQDHC